MHQWSKELGDFMRSHGHTQETLAKAADVSQSTVSRALKRAPARYSESSMRLFTYAGIPIQRAGDFTRVGIGSTDEGIKRITSAFLRVWDGTDANAVAIANIIEALGVLMRERK